MPSLEDLPNELLVMVTENCSPGTALALLQASPVTRNACKPVLTKTLNKSLSNSMEPDVLQAALTLANFEGNISALKKDPNTKPPGPCPPFQRDPNALPEVRPYHKPKTSGLLFPTDIRSLVIMCRTHQDVCDLTTNYTTSAAASILTSLMECDVSTKLKFAETGGWKAITATERTRFERACYRLELFNRLSFGTSHRGYRGIRLQPDWHLPDVFEPITDWEIAEMECVHHYIRTVFHKSICDLKNQFAKDVQDIVSWSDRAAGLYPAWDMKARKAENEFLDLTLVKRRGMHHIMRRRDAMCDDRLVREWNNDLGQLALTGMKAALQLSSSKTVEERRDLIAADTFCGHGSSGALSEFREPNVPDEQRVPTGLMATTDSEKHGPLGFRLFNSHSGYADRSSNPIREMAYPFWDAQRITIPWVKEALEQGARKRIDERENWAPCDEARFYGLRVRKQEFAELQRKYGLYSKDWYAKPGDPAVLIEQ